MKNIWLNDKVLTGMKEQSEVLASMLDDKQTLVNYLAVINVAILKEVGMCAEPCDVVSIADDLITAPKEVDLFTLAIQKMIDKISVKC